MLQLFTALQALLGSRTTDDEGATMVEYGLIVALIAVVVALGATVLGNSVSSLFSSIAGSL
jgi:pilus assembly protein Flp/PilA